MEISERKNKVNENNSQKILKIFELFNIDVPSSNYMFFYFGEAHKYNNYKWKEKPILVNASLTKINNDGSEICLVTIFNYLSSLVTAYKIKIVVYVDREYPLAKKMLENKKFFKHLIVIDAFHILSHILKK